LPERPSKRLQQFHIQGAIYGPPHQGPISRPHPHREPVLIDVPLEPLADPTRWTSHRCRLRSHTSVFGALLSVRASCARCSSFPQARREALVAILGSVLQVRLCQKDFGATRRSDDPQCYWQPPRIWLPTRIVLVCRKHFRFCRQVSDTSSPRAEDSHPNPCSPLRVRPLLKAQADKIWRGCDNGRPPTAQGRLWACSDGPLPREMRFSCRRRCSCARR